MTEDFKNSLEECFCDRHFVLSDDLEDIKNNLEIAKQIYNQAKEVVDRIAEDIEDGLDVDKSSAILDLQNLIFSKRYIDIFENQLRG